MATKETAVGGLIVGGGGAGAGYAVYEHLKPGEEVPPSSEESSESPRQPEATNNKKTVLEVLHEENQSQENSNKDIGKPIEKITDEQDQWWEKAYHRFLLEATDNEKVGEVNGKRDRDGGDTSKKEKFKEGCKALFNSVKEEKADDYNTAKKWCVTFKTIKEELESTKNTLDSSSDGKWSGRFTKATADSGGSSDFKTMINKIKEKLGDGKEKEAIHKWCTIALNAEKDDIKQDVEKYCFDSSAD